jgi:plasmid stabilization system protein ParE
MAQVSYSSRALADLERISDFLAPSGTDTQLAALDLIDQAVNFLASHPSAGRPAEAGLRELVIPQGKAGFLALYSYEADHDAVLILALRHQREAGYPGRASR